MNDTFGTFVNYLAKYRRFLAAGIVAVALAVMVLVATSSNLNPMAGAYGAYDNQTANEELLALLNSYYTAYDENDTEALQKVASPFSDRELNYVGMMSNYIDSHTVEELYTKNGSAKGSLLVSAKVNIKYAALDTPAPGLDFFYVERDDNGYHINNATRFLICKTAISRWTMISRL